MARRRRHYRRRRRNRFAFLYKVLAFLAICAAIVVAMALFFKADDIKVAGNSRYTSEEVLKASGIAEGDNLFLLNKFDAAEQICSKLPYVESVRISRRLPDTLHIVVTESTATLSIEQEKHQWILCTNGKLVERLAAGKKSKAIRVTGLKLKNPQVGEMIQCRDAVLAEQLLELVEQLKSKGMLSSVQEIRLEDPNAITMRYLKSFDVQIPWNADFDYKLNYLAAVIEKLEENEKGTIVLMEDSEARFVPD